MKRITEFPKDKKVDEHFDNEFKLKKKHVEPVIETNSNHLRPPLVTTDHLRVNTFTKEAFTKLCGDIGETRIECRLLDAS